MLNNLIFWQLLVFIQEYNNDVFTISFTYSSNIAVNFQYFTEKLRAL